MAASVQLDTAATQYCVLWFNINESTVRVFGLLRATAMNSEKWNIENAIAYSPNI